MQNSNPPLKPCPYRHVDDEGQILCDKIKSGDRQVSPSLCTACPIAVVQCGHLRARLGRAGRLPIPVHYGNGRTLTLDFAPPSLALEHAACAVKVIPVLSPHDCSGCPLRAPLSTAPILKQSVPSRRRPALTGARPTTAARTALWEAEQLRTNQLAQKIIRLESRLDRQDRLTIPTAPPSEEKCVGWTD